LPRSSVHKVAIVTDKKISQNESTAKEMRTVEIRHANETANHITNQEEDELFRLESAKSNACFLPVRNKYQGGKICKQHGQS
jgi:hypothetical protein